MEFIAGNEMIISGILLSIALVAIIVAEAIEKRDENRARKARRKADRAIMQKRQTEYRKQVLGR